MELSEVISAHFAFPVVGVVLCAVLVFAFGFKSPGQPPSFDLLGDDDDRKYKKSRQKKHKFNIDGHVINIDGHGSPGAKTTTKQQATSSRQATNEKQDPLLSKVKAKKPKPVMEIGIANENSHEEEQDVEATGEWMKAVSKKDRKNRSKKDDVSKKDDFPAAAAAAAGATAVARAERTSQSHEVQKTVHVTHPTVSGRDDIYCNRTQRKILEVTVTAPAPAPTPMLVSCIAVSTGSDAVSVNEDSFSSKVKAATVSVTIASTFHSEPQKSAITSLDQVRKSSSPTCIPKLSQPTPVAVTASHPTPVAVTASHPTSVAVTASQPTPVAVTASQPTPVVVTASHPKSVAVTASQPTSGKGPEAVTANVIHLPGDDDGGKALPLPAAVTTGDKTLAEGMSNEMSKDSSASVTVGDSKPSRSPKKKKKSPESREKYKESPVVSIPADVAASSSAFVIAEPLVTLKHLSHDTSAEEIQTVATQSASEAEVSASSAQCSLLPSDNIGTDKTCSTAAGSSPPFSDSQTTAVVAQPVSDTQPVNDSEPVSDNHSSGDPQPSTLADELGDWQEAKPLKKKRRPHREN